MKKLLINLLSLSFVIVIGLSGCKDDENASNPELEQLLQRVAYTWTLQEATKDGIDLTEAFPGLKLIIKDDQTFVVQNPIPPIWPAEGSFTLTAVSNGRFQIQRSDNMIVTVNTVSETTLVVELNYQSTTTGGRLKSVSGTYEFTFMK